MNLKSSIEKYFADGVYLEHGTVSDLGYLAKIEELGKGLANINYILTFAGNRKFVARFNFWQDKDWYSGNLISIENEYQVLKFLEGNGVSPKVHLCDVSKEHFPYDFLLEEFIEHGDRKVDHDFPGIVQVVKKLHNVTIDDDARKIFRVDASKKKKVSLFEERLAVIETNRGEEIEQIFFSNQDIYMQYLSTVEEYLTGDTIIHHDTFPENFLFRDGWYLVDWQTAALGNPIHDIAYLLMDFIYQFNLGRKLTDDEKNTIVEEYYGGDRDTSKLRKQAETLLPVYYIDLFLFILYKEEKLKSQKFENELTLFLQDRLALGRSIILKPEEIQYWFDQMQQGIMHA